MSNATIIATGIGATLQLFRFSFDLIVTASQKSKESESETANAKNDESTQNESTEKAPRRSTVLFNGRFSMTFKKSDLSGDDNGNNGESAVMKKSGAENDDAEAAQDDDQASPEFKPPMPLLYTSTSAYLLLGIYFLVSCILVGLGKTNASNGVLYNTIPLACSAVACFMAFVIDMRDFQRARFSALQRLLHISSTLILLLAIVSLLAMEASAPLATLDIVSLVLSLVFVMFALVESKFIPFPQTNLVTGEEKKARLSASAILTVLKPYFWPDATATSATLNRIRALTTWFCVAASKGCNLMGPIFLGRATTALARLDYIGTIKNTVIYVSFNFAGSFFKECQSLVYLKVAQAAFVQLSEVSFRHLHSLSLDWHLKKKLGKS